MCIYCVLVNYFQVKRAVR